MAEEPGNVTAQLERGRRGVPKVDEEEAELEAEEDVNVDTMLKVERVPNIASCLAFPDGRTIQRIPTRTRS